MQVRTGGIEARHASAAMRIARLLIPDVQTHTIDDDDTVLALSEQSGCTAYDCEYVALARILGVPLVTWDGALLRSFPDSTVRPEKFVAA